MMRKKLKKGWAKMEVDRKIVECLCLGHSLTAITKSTAKGKGYVIKIKDMALEYGYIEAINTESKIYKSSQKIIPPYPEALFPLKDGRSEKLIQTDEFMEPHRLWIKERLEADWSPQTIFEELPVAIPKTNFYRYLHRNNLMALVNPKNVPEIIHKPGECLQVDWGKLFDVIDSNGKKKTIWGFIGTVGHSRFEMARVVEKMDYATTIEVIMSMFEEMGGTLHKIVCDNPKVFVKEASQFEPILNPAFKRFAQHYGVVIEALPPADPEKKGKVERAMPRMRRLFESYDKKSYVLIEAQAHITRKLSIANERKHGTHLQKPIEVFLNDEAALLKPLPTLKYELETIVTGSVRADGYVRFLNKYYKVDPKIKKEEVLIIGNQHHVSIYCKGRLLEVYDRIHEKFKTKECKDHYKEPWEKTLNDHGHYLDKARVIGGNVERFISIVLARGENFVDTRVVWGLLTLNKKYNNTDINKACESALELSQINLHTVRQLLTIMAKPKEIKTQNNENFAQTIGGKFVRPISEYKKHLTLVYSRRE